MTSSPLSKLSLELAWKRVKLDRPKRCFVTHHSVFDWIEPDLSGWFQTIDSELEQGYAPQDCLPCNRPKGNWMVRPGAILDLKDETVLNAILGSCYSRVFETLRWSQGTCDLAYQLTGKSNEPDWIRSGFLVWKEWREKSLSKLASNIKFVLFTDIAGFYDNIDLNKLQSELGPLFSEPRQLHLLMKLLNRWAYASGKGIPQGYSASDILAKVYLNPVDQAIRNRGFVHLRYVDDIRIFCVDERQAKKALLQLTELLRYRGLVLQTAKTKIMPVGNAREKIDGVTPVIQSFESKLRDELAVLYKEIGPYASVGDIDKILESHTDSLAPEVLELAFREHFLEGERQFDQTLFHYLLNRLGKAKSQIGKAYCIKMLTTHPEETEHILRYLEMQDLELSEVDLILEYAGSEDAIYDYQLYEITAWFFRQELFSEKLINLCRLWALDKNRDSWLRSYCLAVLGHAGDQSDLELIQRSYVSANSGIEKADVITALRKMEVGRRNSFLGRVKDDGFLPRCAVRYVQQPH